MAVAWKATGTVYTDTSGVGADAVVSTPAGVVNGDLLVVFYLQDSNTYPPAPTNWTRLGTNHGGASDPSFTPIYPHTATYYRIANSQGSNTTFVTDDNNFATGDPLVVAVMMAFTGADTTNPIDASEWAVSTASTTASRSSPSVTPSLGGSTLVIWRGTYRSGGPVTFTATGLTGASPAGFERVDSSATNLSMGVWTRDGSFSGAQTYAMLANNTVSQSSEWGFIIRPDGTPISDSDSGTGTEAEPAMDKGTDDPGTGTDDASVEVLENIAGSSLIVGGMAIHRASRW